MKGMRTKAFINSVLFVLFSKKQVCECEGSYQTGSLFIAGDMHSWVLK